MTDRESIVAMLRIAITEEGRSAAYTQRAFFRDLDDAEKTRDVQSTREAVERIKGLEIDLAKQGEAEAIAYMAADEFIKATNESGALIPLNHEGLNLIKCAAQRALDRHDSGRWVVDAALPESDWSRTPALTVRPAASSRPAAAPHRSTL